MGYGHTATVTLADVGKKEIPLAEAERLLVLDVARFEQHVNSVIKRDIAQGQFDALVSLAFNVGSIGSSLAGALNAGDSVNALFHFKRYIHANDGEEPCRGRCGVPACKGRIYQGLINRRADEVTTLWLSTSTPSTSPSSPPSLNARIKEQTARMRAAADEIDRLLG